MAHAQVRLYFEQADGGELWGWRRVIDVEPPEVLDDSGAKFETRDEAFADAEENHPSWPIG